MELSTQAYDQMHGHYNITTLHFNMNTLSTILQTGNSLALDIAGSG